MTNQDLEYLDLLGIPLNIGDKVLCISGSERIIETIQEIKTKSILTESGNVYFLPNVLGVKDIINNNAEYFI